MLATELCGVNLKNPVIAASGTFGFGKEYAEIFDISRLGGISSKGLTLEPRFGNTGERVYETASGLINSIGLQNPGVEAFIKEDLPFMQKSGAAVIVNLGGHDLDSYLKGVELLDSQDFDLLELNISCPNVKAGGMAFGMEPATAGHVVKEVRARCHKPLMVKLSPNAPDPVSYTHLHYASRPQSALAFGLYSRRARRAFRLGRRHHRPPGSVPRYLPRKTTGHTVF